MNTELAQQAVDAAEEYKRQKGQRNVGPNLQPSASQMGAVGKPDGYIASPGYSDFNSI